MRSLALADALRNKGIKTRFICRNNEGNLDGVIAGRGHELVLLSEKNANFDDVELSARALSDGFDWLVVDHYELDATWEKKQKKYVDKILVIDDLANRPHICDVLLDQNLFTNPEIRYSGLVNAESKKLFGPRYALLREEFKKLRQREKDPKAHIKKLLVFFGGGDYGNSICRFLPALEQLSGLSIDIVESKNTSTRDELHAWCNMNPHVRLHDTTVNFSELLAEADVAIGAGGATTWERCCLGLPAIVAGIAENQHEVAKAVAEYGAHLYLGPIEKLEYGVIDGTLRTLLALPELRQHLADKGRSLVDGDGVERVLSHLMSASNMEVRLATLADSGKIFNWRNDPSTRKFFINPGPIEEKDHYDWFSDSLNNPDRVILVGEESGEEIGVVRYDIKGDQADISIYLNPEKRGRRLGRGLLEAGNQWLAIHHPEIRRLNGRVHPENISSKKMFSEAGFICYLNRYVYDL